MFSPSTHSCGGILHHSNALWTPFRCNWCGFAMKECHHAPAPSNQRDFRGIRSPQSFSLGSHNQRHPHTMAFRLVVLLDFGTSPAILYTAVTFHAPLSLLLAILEVKDLLALFYLCYSHGCTSRSPSLFRQRHTLHPIFIPFSFFSLIRVWLVHKFGRWMRVSNCALCAL